MALVMAFARPLLCEVTIDGLGHVREVLFGVEAVRSERIECSSVRFQIQMAPSPSTAWRAARSSRAAWPHDARRELARRRVSVFVRRAFDRAE